MTRLAKAMSAFTPGRSASAGGRDARSFAGRGLPLGVDGSGAPSVPANRPISPGILSSGLLAALITYAALALGFPIAAQAQTFYGHAGEFGGTGTAGQPGLFHSNPMPQRMAVHQESGKLFVADRGNHRIQVFTPTPSGANFDFQFGGSAITNQPIGIAVDQDTGDAYVTAAGTTQAIVKFNPDDADDPTGYSVDATFTSPTVGPGAGQIGSFQVGANANASRGGIAVDPVTGDILVADPGKNLIQRFDAAGIHLDDFNGFGAGRPAFTGVHDLAVNSTGDIIVADVNSGQGRIDRFNSDGVHQATLSQANNPVPNFLLTTNALILTANLVTDEVFATSKAGSVSNESRIFQFADDEYVTDFAAPANFHGWIFGMAVRGTDPGRLYALATQNALFGGIPRVQAFDAAITPEATIDQPTAVTATEATFSGTANPQGAPATWHFQYRPAGTATWSQVPDPSVSAGDGTDPVPVEATASGLEPNTAYEVRLVVSTVVSTISGVETFTTEAAPPIVTTGTATLIGVSQATLRGQIVPRNSETSYRFEYGADTGYGNVIPAPDQAIGAGSGTVLVSAPIAQLSPGSTVHFRLVAENEAGVTVGEDRTFTTRGTPFPARAYEVVSHLPALDALVARATWAESESGDRVLYQVDSSASHFPGFDLPHRFYVAERGENGWATSGADLPRMTISAADTFNDFLVTPDLSRIVVRTSASHHPDDQNEGAPGEEITMGRDLYQRQPGGGLEWMTRDQRSPAGTPQTDRAPVDVAASPTQSALSADGQSVVFRSNRNLVDEDPNPSNNATSAQRLYKWSGGGLKLLSLTPSGAAPTGTEVSLGAGPSFSPNAVSRDGSRVFWRNGSQGYIQIDGEPTVEAPSNATYAWADADLHRVILIQNGRLVMFDVDSGVEEDLTGPAGVLGIVFGSEDANRVYFVASGALVSDPSPLGGEPPSGGRNLYLAEVDSVSGDVQTRFIAPLGPATSAGDSNVWSGAWNFRTAFASPDGQVLGFGSVVSHTGEPTGGTRQLYVYDRGEHSLECASCPADGSTPAGDVNSPLSGSGARGWQAYGSVKRWVSDQGAVFFDTPTRLVPQDRNQQRDVYEYHRGSLRLITPGNAGSIVPTRFSGASRDGSTVFFTTSEALAPQDNEPGIRKVYAARVGGGFPISTPRPNCIGDECQDRVEHAPDLPLPQSEGLQAHGNPVEANVRIENVTRAQLRRFALGRPITINASTSGPGRVTVSVSAQLRRERMVRIARANGHANRSGEAVIRGVRLSRGVQRVLRTRGSLRVRIVGHYRDERTTQLVLLKSPNRLSQRAKRLRRMASRQVSRGNRAHAQRLLRQAREAQRQAGRLRQATTTSHEAGR